jgi:cation diffusion facilitator family transporter
LYGEKVSASGGTKAIIAALAANFGIAVTKFIAYLFSGSSSMLAESVHSLADSGNQVLLLVGGRRGRKAADAEHPFGYGRARYVYAFIVSIILFSVGGVFSVYEGVEKLLHPEELEVPWLPIVVLLVAIVLESFSLRTAIKESLPHKGNGTWVQFIRRAKAPELPVVLLEDVAALTGLVLALAGVSLTIWTGDSAWDGIGTICIGVLLVLVAIVLGLEMASLLVGEGATGRDTAAIRSAIQSSPDVQRVIHMKTLYVGPDELMVGAKVAFDRDKTMADVAYAINRIEDAVRTSVPVARIIYIEPDVYLDPSAPVPETDAIIIRTTD